MITARIIQDSISTQGARLTTFELVYPRFVHADLMTHRVFSRNASSSRAIPVKKFLREVWNNPAMPVWWGKNQPGMQAREELTGVKKFLAKELWIIASYFMLLFAWMLSKLDLHKQITNRILEPWFHMRTIVTATEWENFLNLRRHKDAQPEIQRLAVLIGQQLDVNIPLLVKEGQWHLPYILPKEKEFLVESMLLKACVARCCRVSYMTHDGQYPDIQKDISLHDRLLKEWHMSPFEHAATPSQDPNEWFGNFKGWKQYRKFIKDEDVYPG